MGRYVVLARVKDFLPQIAAANKALDEKIKKDGLQSVDIEHVGEDEEQVIQMVTRVRVLL